MMLAAALALVVAASDVPPAVEAAVRASVPLHDARVSLQWERAPQCAAEHAELGRPLTGSGRVPVKVSSAGCQAWAFLRVQVFADVLVAKRALRAGEPAAGAVEPGEREILDGRDAVQDLAPGAVALRAVPAGATLSSLDVGAPGLRTGEPVPVVLRSGSIELSQPGRAVPCTRGHACAILPSGKRVEGTLDQGRLVVTLP